jgi:biopolymer transport protein ExbD
MNLRRRHKEGAEVSTESLNDIMFFLLLFFLILSTLVNPSVIKVNLPSAQQSQSISIKPIPLVVTADRKFYLNNHEVQLQDLESAITRELKDVKDPSIILQFDSKLTVQDIVDVMQIGAKLKVKMVLGTKPPNA